MTQRKAPARRATPKKPKPATMRLDVACGQHLEDGWTGIELYAEGEGVIKHDLFSFPWPIGDGEVAEVRCSHFVEHIPHRLPGIDRDVWWAFFDELYRIMAPGAQATITHPYGRSDRAWWDPTHERAIVPETWNYLLRAWREAQGLDHYPVVADFDVVTVAGVGPHPAIASRADEFQAHAREFYVNVFADLQVVLERRPSPTE